jgi:hypothetical protein
MFKKTILFFMLIFIFQCSIPPSRESQNLIYKSVTDLNNSSDRIIEIKYIGHNVDFKIDEEDFTSFKFVVLKSFKGSSDEGDEIFITMKKNNYVSLINFATNSEFIFNKDDTFIVFLMGRAKDNRYPKILKGTLWINNGDPSIFKINKHFLDVIVNRNRISILSDDFRRLLNLEVNIFIDELERMQN